MWWAAAQIIGGCALFIKSLDGLLNDFDDAYEVIKRRFFS